MNGITLKLYRPDDDNEFGALYKQWLASRAGSPVVSLRDLSMDELDEFASAGRMLVSLPVFAGDDTLAMFTKELEEAATLKHDVKRWSDAAYKLGVESGQAAASWVADGNTSDEHARKLLTLIEDGDPEMDAYLPQQPNLSGEYADDMNPRNLIAEVVDRDIDVDEQSRPSEVWISEAICDAWEQGVQDTFLVECEKALRTRFPEAEEDDADEPDGLEEYLEQQMPGFAVRQIAELLEAMGTGDSGELLIREIAERTFHDVAALLRREADRIDESYNNQRRPEVGSRIIVKHFWSEKELDRGTVLGYETGMVDRGSPESGPGPVEEEEVIRYRSDQAPWRVKTVTVDNWEEEPEGTPLPLMVNLPVRGDLVLVKPVGAKPGDEHCWQARFLDFLGTTQARVASIREGSTHVQRVPVDSLYRPVEGPDNDNQAL